MRPFLTAMAAILAVGAAEVAPARPVPSVTFEEALPESVGMSTERLARIDVLMQDYVNSGKISGGVGLVYRHGKVVYFKNFGYADLASRKPMRRDAIFRIFSMTKPVTAVAVLMLHEQYGFPLSTPISHWLPEFANPKVVVEGTDPKTGKKTWRLEPARREITVIDLLRHTSGLGAVPGPNDENGEPIYRQLGVTFERDKTIEDFVQRLSKAPLQDQPGTVWRYGFSYEVLGRLIEVISGQPFDRYLENHIFQPLGMSDTSFWVRPPSQDRLATIYTPDATGLKRSTLWYQDGFSRETPLLAGGNGLVSTPSDYLRFSAMLLNQGQLGETRLLSRKSVELMTSDQIGDIPRSNWLYPEGEGDGFGLSVRVNQSPGRNGALGSVGDFGWWGAAGTRLYVDPSEDMVILFFVQVIPSATLPYGSAFKNLVYQAIID